MSKTNSSSLFSRIKQLPPAYFVFVVLVVAIWFVRPHLLNVGTMGTFIRQVAPLGIVVLGQLLVMNARSIDLSCGAVILIVNYIISSGYFGNSDLLYPIFIGLSIGISVGLLNGLLIGKRHASAVIVTLAVGLAITGLVEYLANGKPPGNVPEALRELYDIRFFGLPAPIIYWVALSVVMSLVLSRLVFGRWISSIGENPSAAHFSGVPVERSVVIAHTLAGGLAAIAGLVQTASLAVGSIRFGPELVLNSVAATILGGVIFGKATGGTTGPFFGVLCFALLFILMTLLGIPEHGKLIAQGLIILMAAIIYGVRAGKE
jgi:ribose transport system permease protein